MPLSFLRFLVVGVASNALNYGAYVLLYSLGVSVAAASGAGYALGLVNSYVWGRVWVFGDAAGAAEQGSSRREVVRFAAVYAVGGLAMVAVSHVLHGWLGFDYRLSWLAGAAYAFVNNYLGSRWFVFAQRRPHMAGQFGLLGRLNFLQNIVSYVISGVKPAIIHNLEKYYALKKVHYLSAIEDVKGDYLEFGVFTGSSFCHSLRCCRKMASLNPDVTNTRFFGFDSFQGFGKLGEQDKHPFYTDENFETSLPKVGKRAKRAAGKLAYRLVPGFFSDSLKDGPAALEITKARIVFIDSDTYSSSKDALTFCLPIVQDGTFIILDDFYSYKGSLEKGVARAFAEFVEQGGFQVRQVFTYGLGGAVFVIAGKAAGALPSPFAYKPAA